LGRDLKSLPPAPKGVIFASTSKLPPPLSRFAGRGNAGAETASKVHIVFPPHGASLALASDGTVLDPIAIKIAGGKPPLNLLINGLPFETANAPRTLFFDPDGPGFVRLTIMDAAGTVDSVVVRLQ
jgi:penicillin-binding protein 1C